MGGPAAPVATPTSPKMARPGWLQVSGTPPTTHGMPCCVRGTRACGRAPNPSAVAPAPCLSRTAAVSAGRTRTPACMCGSHRRTPVSRSAVCRRCTAVAGGRCGRTTCSPANPSLTRGDGQWQLLVESMARLHRSTELTRLARGGSARAPLVVQLRPMVGCAHACMRQAGAERGLRPKDRLHSRNGRGAVCSDHRSGGQRLPVQRRRPRQREHWRGVHWPGGRRLQTHVVLRRDKGHVRGRQGPLRAMSAFVSVLSSMRSLRLWSQEESAPRT